MTIALIILGLVTLSLGGLIGWQIHRADARADQLLNERAAHTTTRARLERSEFELKTTQASLTEANQRIAALSAAAEKQVNEPANADLLPGDLESRRVRAAIRSKAAAANRGGPLPAVAAEAVSPARTEAGTDATGLSAAGPLDAGEVLR
jgi:hypothetical protein